MSTKNRRESRRLEERTRLGYKNPHNPWVDAGYADGRVSRVPVFQIDRLAEKEVHDANDNQLNDAGRYSGTIDGEDERGKTKAGNERAHARAVLPRSRILLLAGVTAYERKAKR